MSTELSYTTVIAVLLLAFLSVLTMLLVSFLELLPAATGETGLVGSGTAFENFAMANSYIASPSMGVLVALAIAIHNVPEEFAMAVPIVMVKKRRNYSPP